MQDVVKEVTEWVWQQFYMAWCDHLPLDHVGVYIGSSLSSSNMAPLVFSWYLPSRPPVGSSRISSDVHLQRFVSFCQTTSVSAAHALIV